jgi:hypothetical protein
VTHTGTTSETESIVSATNETEPQANTREEQLEQAGHQLLEAFVAVCGAPDDLEVAASANAALHDLEALLT